MGATGDVAATATTPPRSQDLDFDDFVLARSTRLLVTAYLLTRDHGRAEDLLQTALAETWQAWSRVQEPEAYVRRTMVNTYSSWWQRRWRDEKPTEVLPEAPVYDGPPVDPDVWDALGRLPRGMRAVLVLRFFED